MRDEDLQPILAQLRDENLKLSLPFGIGLHHAGLVDTDRRLVEELFVNRKIQARRPTRRRAARAGRVRADRSGGHEGGRLLAARRQVLIATSTLAWGVNSPTHLVVIKGTEFFDAKAHRYVDMPITDVLQMMGRAGRPQYDDSGIAVVFVHDVKKNFYKKFLYEPFPVGRTAPARGALRVAGRLSGGPPGVSVSAWDGAARARSSPARSSRARTPSTTCTGRSTTAACS